MRRGRAANILAATSRSLASANLLGELPDLEAVHLEFQRAEGNAERSGRARYIPARFLERANQEVPFEGRHRTFEEVFSRRTFGIELGDVQLVRQVLVGDPVLVGDGDDPLDQVLELADVARPPVGAEDPERRICDPLDVLAKLLVVSTD